MSADDLTERDREVPSRSEVDGRDEGQGWWLEEQTAEAFERWGFRVAQNGEIWGQEVDVVASRRTKGRYLCECKDYASAHVTPRDVWRLVALSYSMGCKPVLVHSSPLTEGAAEICRYWRVTRITVADVLHCEEMPRPSRPRCEMGDDVRHNIWNPKWQDKRLRGMIMRDKNRYKWIERSPEYYIRGKG